MTHLHPITTRNPTTCDHCGAKIEKGQVVYFAKVMHSSTGGKYVIGCSPECRDALDKEEA